MLLFQVLMLYREILLQNEKLITDKIRDNYTRGSDILRGNPIVTNYLFDLLKNVVYFEPTLKNGQVMSDRDIAAEVDFIFSNNSKVSYVFLPDCGWKALKFRG